MHLYPEDIRYWAGWLVGGLLARLFLVQPIIRAIRRQR